MDKINQGKEEAKKEGHAKQSDDWYGFVEGENRFRVLTIFEPIYEDFKEGICYTDCGFQGTPKYMCYILDMKNIDIDGNPDPIIKLAKLPSKIAKQIAGYQQDDEWGFDEFPAPYDIKVHAVNAGTKEVEYTVSPSPKREPIADKYLEELKEKKPVLDIIKRMKEKNAEKHGHVLPSMQGEVDSLEEAAAGVVDYPEGDGRTAFDEEEPPN